MIVIYTQILDATEENKYMLSTTQRTMGLLQVNSILTKIESVNVSMNLLMRLIWFSKLILLRLTIIYWLTILKNLLVKEPLQSRCELIGASEITFQEL